MRTKFGAFWRPILQQDALSHKAGGSQLASLFSADGGSVAGRDIQADADPAWEARDAGVRKFLVTKGDGCADGGRFLTLAIAETRADSEIGSVGQAHQQRAHSTLVPARASLVADDDRFSVVEAFDFQESAGTRLEAVGG